MIKSVLVLALVGFAAAHDFTKCATDHLGIAAVSLSPDPPAAGKLLTVQFNGNTDASTTVSKGTASLSVKAFGITIATQNFDICADMGITCPIAANTKWSGKVTYTIPSAAPAGITATAEVDLGTTAGAKDLSCISLKSQIGSGRRLRAETELTRVEYEYLFESWKRQHNKHYISAGEYVSRLNTFVNNHKLIEAHNAKGLGWTMAHNEFSDMTFEQFKTAYLGVKMPADFRGENRPVNSFANVSLPTSVDWSKKGAVTPIKNQGQCGSCWAFSTTGSMEGEYFLKNGKLVSFSEQQLVSCDHNGDQGCNGGLMDNAFGWIKQNGGICKESDYPYAGVTGVCKTTCSSVAGTGSVSHTDVAKNQQALMGAVAKQPVSIAIEADQMGFQFYSSGVFTGTCGTNLDHGVLAVGYGTLSGKSYWKVKNSWGATWGMSGYILLQRGKNQAGGQCGILNSASYPTLA